MFKARLELKLPSRRHAEAVAVSISPDNRDAPGGLKVETKAVERSVITRIECKGRYETFLATLDDVLISIQTAQRSLEAA